MASELPSENDTEFVEAEQAAYRLVERVSAEMKLERPTFTPPEVPPSLEALNALIDQLASRNESQRDLAAAKLKKLGPLATNALIGVLEFETTKRNHRIQNTKIVVGAIVGVVVASAIILKVFTNDYPGNLLIMMGFLGFAGAAAGLSKQHLRAANAIALLNDKRAVPYLAEVALNTTKSLKAVVPDALERLMPLVTAEDRNLLTSSQRKSIAGYVITYPANIRFARIAYRMLGDIAGSEVYSLLNVAIGHKYEKGPWKEIAELAAETRKTIEERLDRESKEDSLLRPAEAPGDDTLLRPAGAGETDEKRLLRPTDERMT
jgi:hypothetical protein